MVIPRRIRTFGPSANFDLRKQTKPPDQETNKTTDDLCIRNFEVCLQVALSSRVNALREMFQFLLEAVEANVHPTTSYEEVIARIEAEQLEIILRGYADEDPNLASAIQERLNREA